MSKTLPHLQAIVSKVLGCCRYVALTKGIIEVKKDGGKSGEYGDNREFVQRQFDLTTHEGLEGYWAQLAQMSVDYRFVCFLNKHSRFAVCASTVTHACRSTLTVEAQAHVGRDLPIVLRVPLCNLNR